MLTKRALAEQLNAEELRDVVERFELEIEDRRARGGMIEAIVSFQKVYQERDVALECVLARLRACELKARP